MQFQALVFFLLSFVFALPWWAGHSGRYISRGRAMQGNAAAVSPRASSVALTTAPSSVQGNSLHFGVFPVSPERDVPHLIGPAPFQKNITAQSALVVDASTAAILYAKDADTVRPIGSITKLLTALTILDVQLDWNKKMTIISEDGSVGPSSVQAGDTLTVNDLLHVGLIASSNIAMNALARATGLAREEFAARMNAKAIALGLTSSHFVEPTGLDKNDVSTATDVARLVHAALENDEIRTITSTRSYAFHVDGSRKARVVHSTDMLLNERQMAEGSIARVVGGKTGFIDEAGYCFAVEAQGANNHAIIVVVLGSRDHWSRFSEAANLAAWTFQNFAWPDKTAWGG